ncbi:MAG: hypothetical protein ABI162_12995 [Luteolibacter sp.]
MKALCEWLIFLIVLWIGAHLSFSSKIPEGTGIPSLDKAAEMDKEFDDYLRRRGSSLAETRVLGWLVLAGCFATIFWPISRFHLLWWPIASWFIWIVLISTGQKLTFAALCMLSIFRFYHLGWAALPGNLRVAGLVIGVIGLAGVFLGPTLTFGTRSKTRAVIWMIAGIGTFLFFQS